MIFTEMVNYMIVCLPIFNKIDWGVKFGMFFIDSVQFIFLGALGEYVMSINTIHATSHAPAVGYRRETN